MHSQTIAMLFAAATVLAAPSWQAEREQALRQHAAGNYRQAESLFRSALDTMKTSTPDNPNVERFNRVACA